MDYSPQSKGKFKGKQKRVKTPKPKCSYVCKEPTNTKTKIETETETIYLLLELKLKTKLNLTKTKLQLKHFVLGYQLGMILTNNTDCTTYNVRETHSLDTTIILINAHAIITCTITYIN